MNRLFVVCRKLLNPTLNAVPSNKSLVVSKVVCCGSRSQNRCATEGVACGCCLILVLDGTRKRGIKILGIGTRGTGIGTKPPAPAPAPPELIDVPPGPPPETCRDWPAPPSVPATTPAFTPRSGDPDFDTECPYPQYPGCSALWRYRSYSQAPA